LYGIIPSFILLYHTENNELFTIKLILLYLGCMLIKHNNFDENQENPGKALAFLTELTKKQNGTGGRYVPPGWPCGKQGGQAFSQLPEHGGSRSRMCGVVSAEGDRQGGLTAGSAEPFSCQESRRQRWIKKSGNQGLANLAPQQLLHDAELFDNGSLTYAALILLGTREALGKHLAPAEVIFEYRSSDA
jgi:hypothetical protein